jgi:hypothetical protein
MVYNIAMTYLNISSPDRISCDQLCLTLFRALDRRWKAYRKLRRLSWRTPSPLLVDEFQASSQRLLVCLDLFGQVFPQADSASMRRSVKIYGKWFVELHHVYAVKDQWLIWLKQFPALISFEDHLTDLEYSLLSKFPNKLNRMDKRLLRKTIRIQLKHLNQLRKSKQNQSQVTTVLDTLKFSLAQLFQQTLKTQSDLENYDIDGMRQAYKDFKTFCETLKIVSPLWAEIDTPICFHAEQLKFELEAMRDLSLLINHLKTHDIKAAQTEMKAELQQRSEAFKASVDRLNTSLSFLTKISK